MVATAVSLSKVPLYFSSSLINNPVRVIAGPETLMLAAAVKGFSFSFSPLMPSINL